MPGVRGERPRRPRARARRVRMTGWIVARIKGIMLVSGALTCTMLYAALRSTLGEALSGPLAEIVVRNWGALIALVGGMQIYGAFDPPGRPLILSVAGLSKLVFIGLVL